MNNGERLCWHSVVKKLWKLLFNDEKICTIIMNEKIKEKYAN